MHHATPRIGQRPVLLCQSALPSGKTATYWIMRMFRSKRNKEEHRYYLLPGMGRSNRRRHREFLIWAIVVGAVVSGVFAYLLYLLSQHY
jgi:hypothetical protein